MPFYTKRGVVAPTDYGRHVPHGVVAPTDYGRAGVVAPTDYRRFRRFRGLSALTTGQRGMIAAGVVGAIFVGGLMYFAYRSR